MKYIQSSPSNLPVAEGRHCAEPPGGSAGTELRSRAPDNARRAPQRPRGVELCCGLLRTGRITAREGGGQREAECGRTPVGRRLGSPWMVAPTAAVRVIKRPARRSRRPSVGARHSWKGRGVTAGGCCCTGTQPRRPPRHIPAFTPAQYRRVSTWESSLELLIACMHRAYISLPSKLVVPFLVLHLTHIIPS